MNRPALFLVLLTGALLGMLPYAAFLDSPPFAAVYAGGTLLAALALAVRHDPAENEPPTLDEHAHAMLGGAALSASAAFLGFMLFGLVYLLAYATGYVGDWLELGWQVNPHSAAAWASGPITLLFGLFALSFSPIPRTLYPDVAGVVSAYAGLLRRGGRWGRILPVLGGAALSIYVYFVSPDAWWWHLVALFMVIGGGGDSMRVATSWSPRAALGREAVRAMQKLYDVLGYNTVIAPRTKDSNADVDSLLKRVDMIASGDEGALAIELKVPVRTNRAVSAAEASVLPIAARVVSRLLSRDAQSPVRVKPVLVLVGRESTADLARLAQEENIKVLHFTEDILREVLKTEDERVLRQLAQRYLLPDPATVAAQSPPGPAASAAA